MQNGFHVERAVKVEAQGSSRFHLCQCPGWGLGVTLRRGQRDADLHFGWKGQLLQRFSF